MIDEDETVEIVRMGSTEVAVIYTGIAVAKMRARSDYIRGRIDVEEFEREIERLLRKEAGLR